MIAEICLFVIGGAALAVALGLACRRQWLELRERAALPEELKGARLEFAERLFRTERPFPLFAKIDRAYAGADGILVLTELKRRFRPRAYRSDVVELSAQRLAIERGVGRRVSEHGFVVVEHPASGERTPIPVSLLHEAELVALKQRYQHLLLGSAVPEKVNDVRLCHSCAYAGSCQPEVLRGDPAWPIKASAMTPRTTGSTLELHPLSEARARGARPVRRRATGRDPGTSKTMARSSPGSDQSRRS